MGDLASERIGLVPAALGGWSGAAGWDALEGRPFEAPERRRAAVAALASIRPVLAVDPTPRVRLGLRAGWTHVRALRADEGLAAAAAIETLLTDLPAPAACAVRAQLDLLRAAALAVADRPEAALAFARRGLESGRLGSEAALGASIIRFVQWRAGDLAGFYAGDPSPRSEGGMSTAFDRALEAAWEAQQLRFASAKRLAQDAIADGFSSATLFSISLLAELAYEAGELDTAWALLEPRLPAFRSRALADVAVRSYPLMARLAARRGEAQLAAFLLREGETLGERRRWPRLLAACLAERVELYVRDGRLADARDCSDRLAALAQGDTPAPHLTDLAAAACLAASRLALATGPDSSVVAELRRLHHDAVARNDLYLAVRISVRLVDALAAVGDADEGARLLTRVLAIGAGSGLYQTLLDGGPRVGVLLAELSAAREGAGGLGDMAAYAEHLARHWPQARQAPRGIQRTTGPLSGRECAILRLVSRGYSNKQIGRELGIAFETVKTHAKNIYGKLDARNRAEAVMRAGRLGLI